MSRVQSGIDANIKQYYHDKSQYYHDYANCYACIIPLRIVVHVIQTIVTIVMIRKTFVISISAMDA